MDLSSNQSQDEDRVMQRQLYRPGQKNEPAAKASAPAGTPAKSVAKKSSAASGNKSSKDQRTLLTPSQRRKALIGLGVAVWLLLLGGISYCLFLPDLDALNKERMALFQDKNLTPEERKEKFEELREKEKNLTPTQRKQMREIMRKEWTRKGNKAAFDFQALSPEDQVAQLKKEAAEWQKRFEERRKMWGDKGGQKGNRGGGQNGGKGGGPGGGPGGGGPPGGGGGGGGGNEIRDRPDGLAKQLDSRSPEARTGGAYKMGMMQQLGLFPGPGGRGGPGGGKGAPADNANALGGIQ